MGYRAGIGVVWLFLAAAWGGSVLAGDPPVDRRQQDAQETEGDRQVKRVLLLGQGPDNHPPSTHEYMAGVRLLAECLDPVDGLETIVVNADEPWEEGPELLDGADGVVLFLSEGAKWLHQDSDRLAAFQKLAERGGGLVTLHWAMGCREAEYIAEYVKLFGGCHGGPDRKYEFVRVTTQVANVGHPIMRGIRPFDVKDEFYYELKFVEPPEEIVPLLRVPIEGASQTVAWAWERPDGGRSFGFSGGHFHGNWELEEYRRMASQAVLWTLKLPIPEQGLPVEVPKESLQLPPRDESPQ